MFGGLERKGLERKGNSELCLEYIEFRKIEGHCNEDVLQPSNGLHQKFYVVYLFFKRYFWWAKMCTRCCAELKNLEGEYVKLVSQFSKGKLGVKNNVLNLKSWSIIENERGEE